MGCGSNRTLQHFSSLFPSQYPSALWWKSKFLGAIPNLRKTNHIFLLDLSKPKWRSFQKPNHNSTTNPHLHHFMGGEKNKRKWWFSPYPPNLRRGFQKPNHPVKIFSYPWKIIRFQPAKFCQKKIYFHLARGDGFFGNPMIRSQMHLATIDPQPNAFGDHWSPAKCIWRPLIPSQMHLATIDPQPNAFGDPLLESDPFMNNSSCFSITSPVKAASICGRNQHQQHTTSCKWTYCSSLNWLIFWGQLKNKVSNTFW